MPTTYAIPNGRTVFDATLYTGTTAYPQTVVNQTGFKPDFVWAKSRSNAQYNGLFDSNRSGYALYSNTTDPQDNTEQVTFNSNGFSTPNKAVDFINTNAYTYVGWQWQAGQGTTSSNTQGSITSTVSVNASAGFSIVTYTGNGTSGATVGHGLGVAPSMIIVKCRSNSGTWWATYHASLGNTKALYLNDGGAASTTSVTWNNTSPTSSVFSLGNGSDVNNNAFTYVAYCWAQVAGFSQFGSYTGNASTDGPFVYLGFRPKFIMYKNSATTNYWRIMDTSVNTYNVTSYGLYPNDAAAEGTATNWYVDYLSNGFKIRASTSELNGSGNSIIYAAFAENPFKNALAR